MARRKNRIHPAAEQDRQKRFKILAVISLFADDDLMERFTLKGGNAIDLIHHAGTRASMDVDVSMASVSTREAFRQSKRG